ncbi:FAD-dependent monooxygenase [Allostreptomyces psammosilenae]|uniref:2-polyprenyl-6-methoxyphenol hydroxylase-like FAD-dependent oxidoreductase n=1 Tax=Allostreptomyces psammosilenae TaxID=1892865 RepID=A0A853ABE7_9ACTN|nr:FAD-dependent monooxygenase [Allostreptomyces psammosilenae]NYI07931.1 2-polyprenyl-6-methoxyphenol hydroxylase-like FAD-dependent oxidoreductase [Allostreptomyces psammosilenae]
MNGRRVLISGASVAGPALAHWLVRYGFDVTVVERAGALREGGQAVDFRGRPQMGVLERMGVLEEIRRQQTHMGEVTVIDARGRRRTSLPSEIASGEVEILRGDLARILYEATSEDAEYVFGDWITSITEDAAGAHVTFRHGAPRTFDLVVGADGVHSGVRRLAFGPESAYRRELGMYHAVFSTGNHLGLDHTGIMYSVPGKSANVSSARDAARATVALYFASAPLAYDHHDTEWARRQVAERFAGEGWEVPRLLEAMWDAPDFYFDSTSQIRVDRYSRGRVVLLGDAGYAPGPGGMGTGLAVVGAYVLAGEMAAARGNHAAAFARYEERMRPYVTVCQKQGEGADRFMVPARRRHIWQRDLIWGTLPHVPWKGLIAKMATRAAEAITLPDYPAAAPSPRSRRPLTGTTSGVPATGQSITTA